MKNATLIFLSAFVCSCCSFPATFGPRLPTKSYIKVEQYFAGILRSNGSGVIVNLEEEGGYVLTAAHVCLTDTPQHEKLAVRDMDDNVLPAIVIRVDVQKDMCMVFVPELKTGESVGLAHTAPEPGDEVFSISSPYGFMDTKTNVVPIIRGTYAGEYPANEGDVLYDMYNMRIAPGSSGGMIVNSRGSMVGMTHRFLLLGAKNIPFFDMSLGVKYEDLKEFVTPYT